MARPKGRDKTRSAGEDLAAVLSEFARTMVTNFPIQGILDHLVRRIVQVLPITAAGVTLIEPGSEPRYVAASDSSALRYEQLQTDLGEGPCILAYSTGHAVSVPDLRAESRFAEFVPRALESGLAAVFTFPLRHADVQLGALDLYRDTAGPMVKASMVSAQTLADVAAAYLINAQARAELEDASDRSREAAMHDALTGLPNRALILELLDHALRASRRSKRVSAVFFMDLDRFKDVNDTHGHQVGDELLIAVAKRVSGALRTGDSLARLSGDEFVILCEDLADKTVVDPIAVRLDAELSRPFELSCGGVTVGASIGVAFSGDGVDSPEELLQDADLAMYQSKRDRIGVHDVLDLRRLHAAGGHATLARELPGALARGEFHLEYQPIVDASTGRVTSAEALLRWTHPEHGAVPPSVFVPVAEQSGQIIELGHWVLEQACADSEAWRQQSEVQISTAVNVSVHQFMSAKFAQSVREVLACNAMDPTSLTLEVTESVFVRDERRASFVFEELMDIGVNLALDDFGTGYSSLGYLNSLPIDTIKIDRTFIAKLNATLGTHEIVAAIIGLAHSIGLSVVCEGIENAQQREQVTDMGADACQGFYFAKPMRAARMAALMDDSTGVDAPCLPPRLHSVAS
jgi:diguanylate cyclase (GGDEF)-like protein